MAAAVILAVGTLLLQGGMLRTANLYGRYKHTLYASQWAQNKLWEARELLVYSDPSELSSDQGSVEAGGRTYRWDLDVKSLAENLYSVRLSVKWLESGVPVSLNREIYAFKAKKVGT